MALVMVETRVEKLGMILEGGGLRGIYTAGVLDCLMDNDLFIGDGLFGVSAGAIHAVSYLSRQRGRSLRVNVDYIGDKRYISLSSLLRTGDMIGVDFTYNKVPNELDPFDHDGYAMSMGAGRRMYAVATSVVTGRPAYFELPELKSKEAMDKLRASASLPMISRNVQIDGQPYLDGGVGDSIPLQAAMDRGYTKNLVILTQVEGFQKQRNKSVRYLQLRYRQYPDFVRAMATRHLRYNETLELVKAEAAAGRALVLQPSRKVEVKSLEKDKARIRAMYEQGYADANERLTDIRAFIQ